MFVEEEEVDARCERSLTDERGSSEREKVPKGQHEDAMKRIVREPLDESNNVQAGQIVKPTRMKVCWRRASSSTSGAGRGATG